MPRFSQGAPKRASNPSARSQGSAPKAGSRSAKHRGYRPDDGAPVKKQRWSSDERSARGRAPQRPRGERAAESSADRADGRPNWEPRQADRRPNWEPRQADAKPRRSYVERTAHGDRPRTERPRGERARFDGDDRARSERPRADRSPDDRARSDRARSDRPRDDRPRFDRDDRARDDRPRGYRDDRARDDRPGTDRSRTERPRFDGDDRGRGERASAGRRPFDGPRERRDGERGPRANHRDDQRGGSRASFRDERRVGGAPGRATERHGAWREEARPAPVDDVVLARLEASAIEVAATEGVTFADLGLGDNITRALGELGATTPFPIQAGTIPEVLTGRDVLGRGRTGSGKTIAFGAPVVERLMQNGGGTKRRPGRAPRALILAPTRELALQIDRTVQPIARSVGLFTTQIYGGVPQHRQVGALQRGVDIVIGTPGRIEDLVEQGRLDLSAVEITVLDEADHMCDLGFLEPVQRILRLTAEGGQRLLFSATLDSAVASLVTEFLDDPSVYEVAGEDQDSSTIEHRVLLIEQNEKRAIIARLADGPGKTLVFARTRAFAEELADELDDAGIPAVSLHGDLNQSRRTRNLERLTSGRVRVLVATDVAARGIHVDDISLVIQADAPEEYKSYLHRSGRTGRAGKVGTVVTLVGRSRRRRMEELLSRAEIDAEWTQVRADDALISDLASR